MGTKHFPTPSFRHLQSQVRQQARRAEAAELRQQGYTELAGFVDASAEMEIDAPVPIGAPKPYLAVTHTAHKGILRSTAAQGPLLEALQEGYDANHPDNHGMVGMARYR